MGESEQTLREVPGRRVEEIIAENAAEDSFVRSISYDATTRWGEMRNSFRINQSSNHKDNLRIYYRRELCIQRTRDVER